MKEHWYKMLRRPFDIGAQPKGATDYLECEKSVDGCFGLVCYDRKLTENEVLRYELEAIKE